LIIPQCRFHPYKLTGAKISFIGSRGSPRAPLEHSALSPRAPRKKTTGVHVRHIRAEPSRLSRLQSRSISRAEEYSRFNPSEPPDVKNRFPDRFSSFLTHFQQSQTSSLLFWAFRIYLQCSFCQIQLPEGDIVIQRAKWLQKMHKHSSRS
jgi:hypothetical protein